MSTEYHFVQTPSEDHFCPICTNLLFDPFLITQCGHHLCDTCRESCMMIFSRNECPVCRKPYNLYRDTVPNLHMKRLVDSLMVHCEHHSKGCTWTGELLNLQEHLDPARRKCDYVLVMCSFGCGQQVRSGEMEKHKTNRCVKRPTTCEYCGFHNKRDYVVNTHYPICLEYPVQCPNKCQVKDLKRGQLQAHTEKCPLQEIACPFNTIGCHTKLPRQEIPSHMKEEVEQHLLLMLEQMRPVQEPALLPPVADNPQGLFNVPPVEFTMTDFLQKKDTNTKWTSPPFYTHQQGYKMCLQVYANGHGDGEGTHLSVFVALMRGEHDKHLEWPFEGDISYQLLNWRKDRRHHEKTTSFNIENIESCVHATKECISIGQGYQEFISHSFLSYNSTTNTEYLQDDCLRLRVKEVAVYSTPIFHKTPSWQDDFNLFQLVCEFTVTEFSKRKQFNNKYYSPPFYSHHRGYKMCLKMYANDTDDGKGTHLSLFACIMEGEHDDYLVWPFMGKVTMELINWREDKGHYLKTTDFNSTTDPDNIACCRTYNEAIGRGIGHEQFISHSSLSYNSITNTEYLQGDCLRLRVKVVVYSI